MRRVRERENNKRREVIRFEYNQTVADVLEKCKFLDPRYKKAVDERDIETEKKEEMRRKREEDRCLKREEEMIAKMETCVTRVMNDC